MHMDVKAYIIVPVQNGDVKWMLSSPVCTDLGIATAMANVAKKQMPELNFVVMSVNPEYSTYSPSELARDIKESQKDNHDMDPEARKELEEALTTLDEMDKELKRGMN